MKKIWLVFGLSVIVITALNAQRIVLQAENARWSSGAVETEHAGYTGTGYVNTTNAAGVWIEFEFSVKEPGNDTLFFVYALSSGNRTASVSVNGTVVLSSLNFPSTGAWTTWGTVVAIVPLNSGMNVVRITALTSGGLANIDRMEVGALEGVLQYKLTISTIGRGTVRKYPDALYYDAGTVVTITAIPHSTSAFKSWSGDVSGMENPVTLVMNSNKSVIAIFQSLIASTIFVSPSGNDELGDGSIENPYYSLQKAVDIAMPGDIIYMRGGTYYYTSTVLISKKGTAQQRFYVLAYSGEKPVLNYSRWQPTSESVRSLARGIKVDTSAAYWYLKGLEICYAPDNGVKSEGAHITFDQCIFHHNGDTGLQIGLNKDTYSVNPRPDDYAAYNVVLNCDSYFNADPATSYENADGFACKLYAGKGNYFYGCRAWYNCDDGWDCYQTEHEIVIENCWAFHNGDPAMWGFSSFNGDGNGFKLGGDNTPCPITVKNCVAFNCRWGAMCGFNDNNNASVINVLNCTAWNCGKCFKLQNPLPILKNNLAFLPLSGARFTRDLSSSAIEVNNSWNLTTVTADANDILDTTEAAALAPRQPDGGLPTNNFAKLVPVSDLIDKGVDIGIPFTGTAPDLGAYEVGVTLPSIPPGIFVVGSPTMVNRENSSAVPQRLATVTSYPNPFNPTTTVQFSLPSSERVTVDVVDFIGRRVAKLYNGVAEGGKVYKIQFQANDLSSGLYFVVLKSSTIYVTQKMMLLK
ncbi:MAG: carbohydrate-binding protein [Bacteroidetes bacterium]|nr:carbohydrate-binding protein [Bacteroidota bacterium]